MSCRGLLPMLTLVLVACEQPVELGVDVEPFFAVGGLAESASGSWTVQGVRTFAFTARRYADGTVAGAWERVNQALDRRHNGIVLCMTIIGNNAWIGTLTKTGPQAGTEGWFRVIDNGEGNAAAPDGMSLQAVNRPPGSAAAYCAAAPPAPALFTVGAGNVQVRTVQPTPPGAACNGQIVAGIASTWPWAHNGQVAFPPPPGAIALWLDIFGPFIGISTVRELQLLFCGP